MRIMNYWILNVLVLSGLILPVLAQEPLALVNPLPKAFQLTAKTTDFSATLSWQLPKQHGYTKALIYRKGYALPIRRQSATGNVDLGEKLAELDIKQQRYGDAKLVKQTRYYYRVVLQNAKGEKSLPSLPAIASLKDFEIPNKVVSIKASIIDDTHFTLRWSASSSHDVQSYRILRSRQKERPMIVKSVAVTDDSSALYHTQITQAKNVGLTYGYAVAAVDAAGNVSPVSDFVSIRLADKKAPANPLLLKAKQKGKAMVLTWRANTEDDLKGYHLYRRLNKAGDPFERLNEDLMSKTLFMDETLASLQNYRYRVSAVDLFGNESKASQGVLVRTLPMKIALPTPTSLKLISSKLSFPNLSWGPTKHTLKATVFRSDGGDFQMVSSLLPNNHYIDDSIRSSKSYKYHVKFISALGEFSSPSNTVLWTGAKQ